MMSIVYETEIEIWAGFGPVGINEKMGADYEQLLKSIFSCFGGQKKFIYRFKKL